jgi:hypothetical protein
MRGYIVIAALGVIVSASPNAQQDTRQALVARAAAVSNDAAVINEMNKALVGKGCSFCIQANFNFKANFDKLATAIAGVASQIGDVEKTLQRMAANLTHALQDIADGIDNLAKSIAMLSADMLLHLVAMKGFLNTVMAEIDLSLLVEELQTSIARVSHRQSLLEPLYKDKGALSPADKEQLLEAILSINEGSALDTEIIHDVLTGSGGVVPGVKPALNVYVEKGYRLKQLANVYGALFVYQIHGYGQLFWAYLNKKPDIMLLDYNSTSNVSANRLMQQWVEFASPSMWHCYWDNGFKCPDRQECHPELRALNAFTCNYAAAPLAIDASVGATTFTIGAASSDTQLALVYDAPSSTCMFGVRDCTGKITNPVSVPLTNVSNVTNVTGCVPSATVNLSDTGIFSFCPSSAACHVIANFSASGFTKHAMYVNESGAIEIIGNDTVVEWVWSGPNTPASGPCPTEFKNRQLQKLTYDSCSCITTARWRKVAAENVNATASWCGRLCQADPRFVAAAPRANGECWCGTPEVLSETKVSQDNCNATCLFCPGAPVEGCGTGNSLSIYTWSSGTEHVAAAEKTGAIYL